MLNQERIKTLFCYVTCGKIIMQSTVSKPILPDRLFDQNAGALINLPDQTGSAYLFCQRWKEGSDQAFQSIPVHFQ